MRVNRNLRHTTSVLFFAPAGNISCIGLRCIFMALVVNNPVLDALSGMIGKELVFRQTRFGTVVAVAPGPRRTSSLAQREQQLRFKQALLRAQHLLHTNAAFEKACKTKAAANSLTTLNAAMAAVMHPPVIEALITDGFNGQAGNRIRVLASSYIGIKQVRVSLLTLTGEMLEEGDALKAGNGWLYVTSNPAAALCKVAVVATDLAGAQATADCVLLRLHLPGHAAGAESASRPAPVQETWVRITALPP